MTGLSVVATCRGEITDVFHYGLRDIARNLSVDNSTIYRVASISKHIGTIGLMQLYERGLFQLDDDVSGALGFKLRNPYFPDKPITFRQVLSHQSSIREGSKYNDFIVYTYNQMSNLPSVKELLLYGGAWYTLDTFDSVHPPGTYFSYSNINFGLMGTLVEKLSGVRFDIYMR